MSDSSSCLICVTYSAGFQAVAELGPTDIEGLDALGNYRNT